MEIKKMNVKSKKEFTISQKSIPSTGYMWEAEFDENMLELKEKEFIVRPTSAIGGGGTEAFTFVPLEKGETTVTMYYRRPWEKKPIEERQYQIVITE